MPMRPRTKRFAGISRLAAQIAPIYGDEKAAAIVAAVARRTPVRKTSKRVDRAAIDTINRTRRLSQLPTIIEELRTMHFRGGRSDKVWGGAVVRRDAPANQSHRYIAFWGRRGAAINVRPFDWTTRNDAYRQWQTKITEKELEGYQSVPWNDAQYGLVDTIRELGVNIGVGGAEPDPSNKSDGWLSVGEAAARLGVTSERVRMLIENGELEVRRGDSKVSVASVQRVTERIQTAKPPVRARPKPPQPQPVPEAAPTAGPPAGTPMRGRRDIKLV